MSNSEIVKVVLPEKDLFLMIFERARDADECIPDRFGFLKEAR